MILITTTSTTVPSQRMTLAMMCIKDLLRDLYIAPISLYIYLYLYISIDSTLNGFSALDDGYRH